MKYKNLNKIPKFKYAIKDVKTKQNPTFISNIRLLR